jgi:hypothetical protein
MTRFPNFGDCLALIPADAPWLTMSDAERRADMEVRHLERFSVVVGPVDNPTRIIVDVVAPARDASE